MPTASAARPEERLHARFGPGVITGAADNDPSGIATVSQAGAEYGYGLLWILVFELPLLSAIQEACGRLGAVTGKGIAALVRENYPRPVLLGVTVLIAVANTINVGADLGAIASAVQLLAPVPFLAGALGAALLITALEVFVSYRAYARILRWLAVFVLCYAVVALAVREPWAEIVRATFVPTLRLDPAYLFLAVGMLGTTISPYMFFWQASEEVEEELVEHRLRRRGLRPRIDARFVRELRLDTFTGMFISLATSWFILVATATVLHGKGITEIRTASDAAQALEPLVQSFPNAGLLTKVVFAAGVVGLGLLGIPVLAGSTSYAVAEAFHWREGLASSLREAPGFYGVIAASTVVGLALNLAGIDPVRALVLAAVCNGVAAVPLIFVIARMAASRRIMGRYRSGPLSNALVWLTFALMAAAALALLATTIVR